MKHFVINGHDAYAHFAYTDCFNISVFFLLEVVFLLFTLIGLQTLKIRGRSSIEQGVAK
jgi:hypothetical protein